MLYGLAFPDRGRGFKPSTGSCTPILRVYDTQGRHNKVVDLLQRLIAEFEMPVVLPIFTSMARSKDRRLLSRCLKAPAASQELRAAIQQAFKQSNKPKLAARMM